MTRRDQAENYEPVEIEGVVVVNETDLAIYCMVDDRAEWIPKSEIHDDSEVYDMKDGKIGTLIIPRWLAKKKGLI